MCNFHTRITVGRITVANGTAMERRVGLLNGIADDIINLHAQYCAMRAVHDPCVVFDIKYSVFQRGSKIFWKNKVPHMRSLGPT